MPLGLRGCCLNSVNYPEREETVYSTPWRRVEWACSGKILAFLGEGGGVGEGANNLASFTPPRRILPPPPWRLHSSTVTISKDHYITCEQTLGEGGGEEGEKERSPPPLPLPRELARRLTITRMRPQLNKVFRELNTRLSFRCIENPPYFACYFLGSPVWTFQCRSKSCVISMRQSTVKARLI